MHQPLSLNSKVMEKQREDIDVKFLIGLPPEFEAARHRYLEEKSFLVLQRHSHIQHYTISDIHSVEIVLLLVLEEAHSGLDMVLPLRVDETFEVLVVRKIVNRENALTVVL